MMHSLLIEGAILLGVALACVLIFRWAGLGSVLGYLVAGILVGPYGFGLVAGAESKFDVAELGIAVLLFVVGLELSPHLLWKMKRHILGLGAMQVGLCTLGLFAFIWIGTRFSWAAAMAVALSLALSSTAQVLPVLQSARRLNTALGRRAFGILLFQDLALIPILTIIAALSRAPVAPDAPTGLSLALTTIVAVVALALTCLFINRPLLSLARRLGGRELVTVAAVFSVIGACAFMAMLHLSPALGAFVAGVMLANTQEAKAIENDIVPFRTVLIGLFFIAIGMMLDLSVVIDRPLFILQLVIGVLVVKTAIIFILGRLWGLGWGRAFALGLLLSQAGEFGFLLFAVARRALLIDAEAASVFGAVVTITMATTPFLMRIVHRYDPHEPEGAPAPMAEGLAREQKQGVTCG